MEKTLYIAEDLPTVGTIGAWEFYCDGDMAVFGGHWHTARAQALQNFETYPGDVIRVDQHVEPVRGQ